MATKPPTTPTWATDAGTTLEPSAGQKAAGFTLGTRPPARWFNWFFNLVSQWLAYLRDGAFAGGVSVAGGLTADTVHATGGATVDGGLTADTVHATGAATLDDTLDVGGDATVSGALEVTGATTLSGGVAGPMAATGAVSGTTGSFSGAITAPSIAATGRVSGAGTSTQPAVSAAPGASGATAQRAALAIGAQKAPLAALAKGDLAFVQANVATPGDAKLVGGASATQQDRYVPQVASGGGTVLTVGTPVVLHTIAAGSLRAGSVVRCRVVGRVTNAGTGGTITGSLVLIDGAAAAVAFASSASASAVLNEIIVLDGLLFISADPSAACPIRGGGVAIRSLAGADGTAAAYAPGGSLNTTTDCSVRLNFGGPAGTIQFTIDAFLVEQT